MILRLIRNTECFWCHWMGLARHIFIENLNVSLWFYNSFLLLVLAPRDETDSGMLWGVCHCLRFSKVPLLLPTLSMSVALAGAPPSFHGMVLRCTRLVASEFYILLTQSHPLPGSCLSVGSICHQTTWHSLQPQGISLYFNLQISVSLKI